MRAYYQYPYGVAGILAGSSVAAELAADMPFVAVGPVAVASFVAEPFVAGPSVAGRP